MTATAEEVEQAEAAKARSRAWGFDVGAAGPRELVIRAVPSLLADLDAPSMLRSVLADMREYGASQVLVERRNELSPPSPATPPSARTAASRSRR
jgi:DNA mismatch repair protein MutL